MMSEKDHSYYRWRPHPWHGVSVGPHPPEIVHAYIEITPFDTVKYEIDKETGYMCVSRPQRTSSTPPTLYGFIPRTFCDNRVSALAPGTGGGDGDPLDICVISERNINRGEIILNARVVGGIQMIDDGKADDKIIAILANDDIWGEVRDVSGLPPVLVERLKHYFETYKMIPIGKEQEVEIRQIYGREHALKVIQAAIEDYQEEFKAEIKG